MSFDCDHSTRSCTGARQLQQDLGRERSHPGGPEPAQGPLPTRASRRDSVRTAHLASPERRRGSASRAARPSPRGGACTAARRTTGTWSDDYRSGATVTDTGDVPLPGWMVDWSLPGGQSVAGLWSGDVTYTGQNVMVHHVDWNGSLDPGRSATFGCVVEGSGGDTATVFPCRPG